VFEIQIRAFLSDPDPVKMFYPNLDQTPPPPVRCQVQVPIRKSRFFTTGFLALKRFNLPWKENFSAFCNHYLKQCLVWSGSSFSEVRSESGKNGPDPPHNGNKYHNYHYFHLSVSFTSFVKWSWHLIRSRNITSYSTVETSNFLLKNVWFHDLDPDLSTSLQGT
jgi:hypothetical protein